MYSLSPLLSLSCRTPLFVSPKETVYAPYPSLLCAHLLHFLSIPPHCLLSLSILPINHSAQSLPPTEAMSPPPPEMNDWQVCSVSNTQQDNMERGENGWLSSQREWGREGGWRERTSDILYLISRRALGVANILLVVMPHPHGRLLHASSSVFPRTFLHLFAALRFLPQVAQSFLFSR